MIPNATSDAPWSAPSLIRTSLSPTLAPAPGGPAHLSPPGSSRGLGAARLSPPGSIHGDTGGLGSLSLFPKQPVQPFPGALGLGYGG